MVLIEPTSDTSSVVYIDKNSSSVESYIQEFTSKGFLLLGREEVNHTEMGPCTKLTFVEAV